MQLFVYVFPTFITNFTVKFLTQRFFFRSYNDVGKIILKIVAFLWLLDFKKDKSNNN